MLFQHPIWLVALSAHSGTFLINFLYKYYHCNKVMLTSIEVALPHNPIISPWGHISSCSASEISALQPTDKTVSRNRAGTSFCQQQLVRIEHICV